MVCLPAEMLVVTCWICVDTWDEPSLLVATKNHVLKLVPDAVGHRTYEVLAVIDGNITALAVDIPAKMLYFATASPPGVHGLSVSSGNIFRVSIEKPGTPWDWLPLFYPPFASIAKGEVFVLLYVFLFVRSTISQQPPGRFTPYFGFWAISQQRVHGSTPNIICVRTMSADVPPHPVGSIGPWGAGEGELKTQKIGGGLIRAADSYHFYFSQRCQMWSSM